MSLLISNLESLFIGEGGDISSKLVSDCAVEGSAFSSGAFGLVGELGLARDDGCMLLLGRAGSRGVKSWGEEMSIGGTVAILVVLDP